MNIFYCYICNKATNKPVSQNRCPFCHGPLYETEFTEEQWNEIADKQKKLEDFRYTVPEMVSEYQQRQEKEEENRKCEALLKINDRFEYDTEMVEADEEENLIIQIQMSLQEHAVKGWRLVSLTRNRIHKNEAVPVFERCIKRYSR